jgi:hypothetical protein
MGWPDPGKLSEAFEKGLTAAVAPEFPELAAAVTFEFADPLPKVCWTKLLETVELALVTELA